MLTLTDSTPLFTCLSHSGTPPPPPPICHVSRPERTAHSSSLNVLIQAMYRFDE